MPRMMRGGPGGFKGMMPFMMMMKGGRMGGMKMMPWMFFPMPFMFIFFILMMATRGNPLMIVGFAVCLVMMVIGGGAMMIMQQGEDDDEKPKHDDTDGIVTATDGKRYIRTEDGSYREIAE